MTGFFFCHSKGAFRRRWISRFSVGWSSHTHSRMIDLCSEVSEILLRLFFLVSFFPCRALSKSFTIVFLVYLFSRHSLVPYFRHLIARGCEQLVVVFKRQHITLERYIFWHCARVTHPHPARVFLDFNSLIVSSNTRTFDALVEKSW